MSSSSSSMVGGQFTTVKQCKCGGLIKPHTSWTDLNPGRRFEACENNQNKKERWHFWEWVDKEICPRGKEVLPGLLRRLRGIENEITTLQEEKMQLEEKLRVLENEKKELEGQNRELRNEATNLGIRISSYEGRKKKTYGGLLHGCW